MIKVALVGGTGGIGSAMLEQLSACAEIESIHATYLHTTVTDTPTGQASMSSTDSATSASHAQNTNDANQEQCARTAPVHWSQVDITDEHSVQRWIAKLGNIDWLINCAGFLHDSQTRPEKSISQFNPVDFQKSMNINCLANLLLAKHAAKALKQSERGIFASITAKVGSIEDNRLGGWYSYRAAKAAANMVLKSVSIEWQRTAPTVRVVALHPGTTDTKLSKPFQAHVKADQLFSPKKVAALLITQLDQLHDFPSGRFIAYDGEELPW